MRTEEISISPELAAQMLELNKGNRRMSPNTVTLYAGQMRRGEWRLTHQGIAFDKEGFLMDGQTRLAAIVQSGLTIDMMVAYDCDRDTFAVLDVQRRRQAGQLLDCPNSYGVAAALRVLWCLKKGQPLFYAHSVSNAEVISSLAENPSVGDAVQLASTTRALGLPISAHAAVLSQAISSNFAPRIESWIYQLREGVGLDVDSPVRHLRNRFERKRAGQIGNTTVVYTLIAKAWNAHALGRPMRQLKTGDSEEPPVIVGLA